MQDSTARDERCGESISVGDIYEDCAYHPVLCTAADGDDLEGISLFDGTRPRRCSICHCGVRKLTADQISLRIRNRDRWLAAEQSFRREHNTGVYSALLAEEAGEQ